MQNKIKSTIKIFLLSFLLLSFSSNYAQDMPDSTSMHKNMKMHHSKMDSTHHSKMMKKNMNHAMKDSMKSMKMIDTSSMKQKMAIDVKAIDKNKDGKVYQDFMDWDVIKDEPGECPVCGMTLREVSIKEAEKNLIKHGMKVK